MTQVKYVGFDAIPIDTVERKQLEARIEHHALRITRLVHNELEFVVQFKALSKTGERHNFVVHMRAVYPGGTMVAEKDGWVLPQVVEAACEAIEEQLKHKFKI